MADPSVPVLDKDGLEYPDAIFSLETLLQLPTNKKHLKKKRKTHASTHKTGSNSNAKNLPDNNSGDSGTSSSSSNSFVVIPPQNTLRVITPDPFLLDLPPSLGATPTATPVTTPPLTPSPPPSPPPPATPPDHNMTTLKERLIFSPSEKFDGRNKALTKQHWQTFEDFCDQQKLHITDRDPDITAATIDQIEPFFKMTQIWLEHGWKDKLLLQPKT